MSIVRPFLSIARAEWRLLVRRRGYATLLVAFTVLLGIGLGLGALRQGRERAQQASYQKLVRDQWDHQPDRHPHRVAHYGTFAFKAPGALAAFDPGVDSYAGRVLFLEAHRQNSANFAEAGALSSAFRLGELSPAFVLQTLLPLVVIILGYRCMARETESGRLRLLLGQGVSMRVLALGKTAGLGLGLVPFLAVAGAALIAGVFLSASGEASALFSRIAVIGAALLLYAIGWLALTLWISARSNAGATALAILAAVWAATCVVLPRGAAAWADARHPLPTKSEFTARLQDEVQRLGDSHNPDDPTFTALRRETLARHGVIKIEDLPVNYSAVVMQRSEELSSGLFARHYDELTAAMERQNTLVRRAAFVAPILGFSALSAAASGTDLRSVAAFQREAEAFRYAFVQRLNNLHRDKIRQQDDKLQRLGAGTWREFPDFHPSARSLKSALAGSAASWLALALWVLVPAVALVRIRFRRA